MVETLKTNLSLSEILPNPAHGDQKLCTQLLFGAGDSAPGPRFHIPLNRQRRPKVAVHLLSPEQTDQVRRFWLCPASVVLSWCPLVYTPVTFF